MALLLNKIPAIATLANIYRGQINPQKIGKRENVFRMGGVDDNHSPHVVAFDTDTDSVTMQAFFDASISAKAEVGNIPITYMQVGQFKLNGVSLPVSLHQTYVPYPTHDRFYDLFGKKYFGLSSWVDIAAKTSDQRDITRPYYPYWILEEDVTYDTNKLSMQPQQFGSLFFNNGVQKRNGEYQCLYMKKSEKINLNRFPVNYSPADYINSIDFTQYKSGGNLPVEFTPQNMRVKVQEIFNWLDQSFRASLLSPGQHFILTNQRLFLQYNAWVKSEGRGLFGVQLDRVSALIYPTNNGGLSCVYLDEDIIEEQNDYIQKSGPPDFDKIMRSIAATANTLLSINNTINIEYEYITYACQYNDTLQNKIQIKLLEGFVWKAGRSYTNNAWTNLAYEVQPLDVFGYYEKIFKDTVNLYFDKLPANRKAVQWG